jgi:hypothetical protein
MGVGTALAAEADAALAACSDEPYARLAMAAAFYRDHGGAEFRYERAPLAFMRWEVRRGVLNPLAAGGSAWWRGVNGCLLRDAEEARLIIEAGPQRPSNPAVECWLAFIQAPSRSSWYAAHNSSIVRGYIEYAEMAQTEVPLEQLLINNTITRVLFAAALEDGQRLDLGPLATIARRLGDPRTRGVGAFVSVPDFYPDHYPLSREDDLRLTDRVVSVGAFLAAVMNHIVVAPAVPELFGVAAERLHLPPLARFVYRGVVAYPWPLLVAEPDLRRAPVVGQRPSLVLRALAELITPGGRAP